MEADRITAYKKQVGTSMQDVILADDLHKLSGNNTSDTSYKLNGWIHYYIHKLNLCNNVDYIIETVAGPRRRGERNVFYYFILPVAKIILGHAKKREYRTRNLYDFIASGETTTANSIEPLISTEIEIDNDTDTFLFMLAEIAERNQQEDIWDRATEAAELLTGKDYRQYMLLDRNVSDISNDEENLYSMKQLSDLLHLSSHRINSILLKKKYQVKVNHHWGVTYAPGAKGMPHSSYVQGVLFWKKSIIPILKGFFNLL